VPELPWEQQFAGMTLDPVSLSELFII